MAESMRARIKQLEKTNKQLEENALNQRAEFNQLANVVHEYITFKGDLEGFQKYVEENMLKMKEEVNAKKEHNG